MILGRTFAAEVLIFVSAVAGAETLYNGIVLPESWPPKIDTADPNPMPVPYLEERNIPRSIPIDLGRQLRGDGALAVADFCNTSVYCNIVIS